MKSIDLLGNTIHGPAEYVFVLDPHGLGGGLIAQPGTTMLLAKGDAIARIQKKFVRRATPEEIALFEAERARDAAAVTDARAGDDEAERLAAQQAQEQAVEEEVERRIAGRLAQLNERIAESDELDAKAKLVCAREIENTLAGDGGGEPDGHDDDKVPTPDNATHRDPQPQNADPRAGSTRGGRSSSP